MIKIIRSIKTGNFIIDKTYYELHQYTVVNDGDYIDIKHIELDYNLYTKQIYSGFVKEDGSTFVDVNECISYLRFIIAEPLIENEIDEQLDIEKNLYRKRVRDGKEMSMSLMAELRVMSKVNNYPREVNRYIEDKLDKVKINIDRGWWVTALEELEATIPMSFYTQELYNRIHLTISTYIKENY